jgi:long-chain alkane monooxygenase
MSQVEPAPFILNAFEMTTVSHTNFGLWRHPEDRTSEYTGLRFWTDLARLLDEGGFDGLFIADGVGQLDVYGGSAAAALAGGVQARSTTRCWPCRRWRR